MMLQLGPDMRTIGLGMLAGALTFATPAQACPRLWTGWDSIPGGGTFADAPALISHDGQFEAFARHATDIITNQYDPATDQWSGWQATASGQSAQGSPSVAIVGNQLLLFAASTSDQLIHFATRPLHSQSWSGWQTVPGGLTTPSAVAAAGHNAAIYLVARSASGALFLNGRLQGGPWIGWREIPGSWRTDAAPAIAISGNRLFVFVKGLDSRSYVNAMTLSTSKWDGWKQVPGGGTTDLALRAAVDGSTIALIGHGIGDHHQYLNVMSLSNEQWTGWSSVGGGGVTNDVTAVASNGGTLAIISAGSAVHQLYLNQLDQDTDCDGIANHVERVLLARFRPFYRFSLDSGPDPFHPADALSYVRNSALLDAKSQGSPVIFDFAAMGANPSLALAAHDIAWGFSDRRKGPAAQTQFQLKPALGTEKGEPDVNLIQQRSIGLYGHVSPLPLSRFKVEYWQFYGFNDAITEDFRHEGDWENVSLVVGADQSSILRVDHAVHDTTISFEIAKATSKVPLADGGVEFRGPNYGTSFWGPSGSSRAQNNVLRLFCFQGLCTHPEVYIEHSGHASWPVDYMGWVGARKHGGDGKTYLVTTPCNLGEVNAADPSCAGSDIILHYNGHWGARGDAPDGPTLKGSWGN